MLITESPLMLMPKNSLIPITKLAKISGVSRKTFKNILHEPQKVSSAKKAFIKDNLREWIQTNMEVIPELQEYRQKNDPATINAIDDFRVHPWFDTLRGREEWYLKYSNAYAGKRSLLPIASLEELKRIEDIDYEFCRYFDAKGDQDQVTEGFFKAKEFLLEQWEHMPLQEGSSYILSKNEIEESQNWSEILAICDVMKQQSILYVTALVDISWGNGQFSEFDDLIPSYDWNEWKSPFHGWVDGLQKQAVEKTLDGLGILVSKWLGCTEESGIRSVRKWKQGKVSPSQYNALKICANIEPTERWRYSKHYLRYELANYLYYFHKQFSPENFHHHYQMKKIYKNYSYWFDHHKALNKKAPAQKFVQGQS